MYRILLLTLLNLSILTSSYAEDCTEVAKICIEGSETRVINGVSIYKECWKYDITKKCNPKRFVDYCEPLSDRGDCFQLTSKCSKYEGEHCVSYLNRYSCQSKISEELNTKRYLEGINTSSCPDFNSKCQELAKSCSLVSQKCLVKDSLNNCNHYENRYECKISNSVTCAKEDYCIGNSCQEVTYEKDGDFAKAATHLAILNEIDEGYDQGNINIFGGTSYSCDKDAVNYSNCCKSSGWSEDINLGSCTIEEKNLSLSQSKGRCVYIGSYCSKKLLGSCLKKSLTSCCFSNKLSKVIQEQGRVQLGINWGDARSPNCRALTPEELTKLDFSKMDLTELFEDVKTDIEFHGLTEEELSKKIDEFYKRGSHEND